MKSKFYFVHTPGGRNVRTPGDTGVHTPGDRNVLDICITRALYVFNLYLLKHKRNNSEFLVEPANVRFLENWQPKFEKKAVAAM